MSDTYAHMVEVSEMVSSIKQMKDKVLDNYYTDTPRAKELLIGLNELEDDAENLIQKFKSIF
jgi:hypothetical protein